MNDALKTLSRRHPVRRALLVSALLSALSVTATALAFTLIARLTAEMLLRQVPPVPTDLLLVGSLLLLRAALTASRERLGAILATREIQTLRDDFSLSALRLGPVALAGRQGAELALLNAELDARFTPFFARFLPNAVHAGVSIPILLAFTFWLDPSTALLLALTGPLTVVFLYLVGLATHAATEAQWQAHTRLGARVVTVLRHLPTLHGFGQVQPYRAVLERTASRHRETTMRVLRVAFLSGFVMEFAGTLSTALVAVWIGVRLFGGAAELAPTLAALMLVAEYFGPLRQVGADRHAAMDAEPLATRVLEITGMQVAPSGPVRPGPQPVTLDLQGVRADLPHTLPHDLARLSAHLPSGTHAALRGPSGSGKSSLLHALRKHVPHQGTLLVDGTPLDALDSVSWQSRVAFVPQHPRLISGSVRDNLRLHRPDASEAEVMEAARSVGLQPLFTDLPQGLDTPLGEGGLQLSGGETARLALARALLSRPQLVLLDEVTAHLDSETEADILHVIRRAFEGITVLLATHRAVPQGFTPLTFNGERAA